MLPKTCLTIFMLLFCINGIGQEDYKVLYNKDGSIHAEGTIKDKKWEGDWKIYTYKHGRKVVSLRTFNSGVPVGKVYDYVDSTNEKLFEGWLVDGKPDSVWTLYEAGKIKSIKTFRSGKLSGKATIYSSTKGHVISEGGYVENKRVGEWRFYATNSDKLYAIENYHDGLMENMGYYYDTLNDCNTPDCNLTAKGLYHKNLREGVWSFYYPNGALMSERMYRDSLPNGKSVYYDSLGKIVGIEHYTNNQLDGYVVYYSSITGKKTFEGHYVNGRDSGLFKIYFYDNREVVKDFFYVKDGLLDGESISYDSITLKKVLFITYLNDKKHGPQAIYSAVTGYLIDTFTLNNEELEGYNALYDSICGTKVKEGHITKGALNGKIKIYYPCSKSIYAEQTVKNGLLDGPAEYYDSASGKIITRGNFKKGGRNGKWVTYADTTIVLVENYSHGELSGQQKIYDSLGRLYISANYSKGLIDGEFSYFYADEGKLWLEATYKKNLLDGVLKTYYRDGKLKRLESYNNGTLISAKCFSNSGEKEEYYPIFVKPEFEGDLMTFIGNNLVYPTEAKRQEKEGKVVVKFTINESGYVSSPEIIQSAGYGMDEEAIRLVLQMPPWQPYYFDGVPRKAYKTIPIVFWLPEE